MGNIKVLSEEYQNIQGVAVKKLKVRSADFTNLKDEGLKAVVEEVKPIELPKEEVRIEEVKPVVKEEKVEVKEQMPSYFSRYTAKEEPKYNIDETALKERIAEKYKDKKEETKSVVPKKPEITEDDFEKLLSTPITIMKDKQDMISKIYSEKQAKYRSRQSEHARLADLFQKLSTEEQVAKNSKEAIEKRLVSMQNEDLFPYLAQVSNEDNAIVEAGSILDEALKNYFNVNQVVLKETISKIEKIGTEKSRIDKTSEKVRAEIIELSEELNKYMKDSAPLLKEMIRIDAQYKDAEKETDKVIKDEYDSLVKEDPVVGLVDNYNNDSNAIIGPEPVMPNAFENFKRVTAVQGINDYGQSDFDNSMNSISRGL